MAELGTHIFAFVKSSLCRPGLKNNSFISILVQNYTNYTDSGDLSLS